LPVPEQSFVLRTGLRDQCYYIFWKYFLNKIGDKKAISYQAPAIFAEKMTRTLVFDKILEKMQKSPKIHM
jgi:hypothetical protein